MEHKNNSKKFCKSLTEQITEEGSGHIHVDGDVRQDHCQQYLMDRNGERGREKKKRDRRCQRKAADF